MISTMLPMIPMLHFRLPTLPTWPIHSYVTFLCYLWYICYLCYISGCLPCQHDQPSWQQSGPALCHLHGQVGVTLYHFSKSLQWERQSSVTLPLSFCHQVGVTLFHKVQNFFQNHLGWKRSSSDNYFHFSHWSHLLSFPCSDGAPPGANGHPVPITYEGFTLLTDNYNNFFMSSFIPQVKII